MGVAQEKTLWITLIWSHYFNKNWYRRLWPFEGLEVIAKFLSTIYMIFKGENQL